MKKIETKNAPGAIGPYSQGFVINGFVFTSGQIAINPATGAVEAETIEAQTEQAVRRCRPENPVLFRIRERNQAVCPGMYRISRIKNRNQSVCPGNARKIRMRI